MKIKILALALLFGTAVSAQNSGTANVTRATLDNGLRVVIVRDALAPVATLQLNYLAGGNESPASFPGMAHAQEHMAFRGCAGLTADQIAAIYAQIGGFQNAETRQGVTRYFVTLPAQDLDLALRINAACMSEIENSQAQWEQERGAMLQEVSRDLSSPVYAFITRINHDLFRGTPYETDPLGTTDSLNKTTAAMLKEFYEKWYAPNNAILVITGDIDAAATLAKIREYYGKIERHDIPAKPEIHLQPVEEGSVTLDSNLPYLLTLFAIRFPGTNSPDFAPCQILADALASQRADLYALVPQGKALDASFAVFEANREASTAYAYGALPAGAGPAPLQAEIKKILRNYATNGIPPELVEASKKSEVASAEFARNSISNLASLWSQALADEGRQSPDEIVEALKRVTVEDVNRVAKKYLLEQNWITGTLQPKPSGAPVASKGFGGSEKITSTPTKPVALPDWAEVAVKSLRVPKTSIHPVDMKLANGIRLIVETQRTSPTITLLGSIKTQTEMQTPPGQDGVADVLEGLFAYGTKTLDRLAFQKALDDIAASENAGANFSLKVLKEHFGQGVELLADNELHPALPREAFQVVQQQAAQESAGELESPGYKTSRALTRALVPPKDPLLRETTPQTISSLKYEDIQRYYDKTFRPDLTTIAVIGDITPEAARTVVEKYFGAWKTEGSKPDVTLPPVPGNRPSGVNVPDPSRVQDDVTLAQELEMNRFTPDYYALRLGNHVLAGGLYATRLWRDLRQNTGYVYTVDNSIQAGETRATYSIDFGCDPKNVSKARAIIERDLRDMAQSNVSPAELQQAKALILRQIPLAEASEDAVAGGFIARARIGMPLDEPFRAAEKYFAMTADEVRAAFAKRIKPADFVQVVRGPAPQ
ncbi:MAG TPA: pitrilysin family protein [Bryobacteraceae bacterium]